MTQYRDIIFDIRLLSVAVTNTTAEAKAQATANAAAELATRQEGANVTSAAVTALDNGLHNISLDIDALSVPLSPAGREADIMGALTDSREGREKRSATRTALDAHRAYLTEIRLSGHRSVRPTVALESSRAQAELSSAIADHAACVAIEACGLSFAAGTAQRALEGGTGALYPAVGRTADLLAEAKRLYGVASTLWTGCSQERLRLERGTNR
jgi:hypothetical protein